MELEFWSVCCFSLFSTNQTGQRGFVVFFFLVMDMTLDMTLVIDMTY